MTINYYALKKTAANKIKSSIRFLVDNPNKAIPLVELVISFQEEFGFGEKMLMKMLDPYLESGKLEMDEHGNLRSIIL